VDGNGVKDGMKPT